MIDDVKRRCCWKWWNYAELTSFSPKNTIKNIYSNITWNLASATLKILLEAPSDTLWIQLPNCSKGLLLTDPLTKLVRKLQMREVFSSFYFPHFIGNLRWEVSTEASLRLTNPPKWWACHEWWKKPIHLVFLDYCHPSGPRPIGNGLGSTPDLVGSRVTGSLLARKRVIASNRSVGFLLLIQPTASSRHFDRQSNSFTPLLTAALHQDEANVDLL